MRNGAPERLVSGSDDFTMFLWEPEASKTPKKRMTGHQQVCNLASASLFLCKALLMSALFWVLLHVQIHFNNKLFTQTRIILHAAACKSCLLFS